MAKALMINLENCLGCRLCEMVCSAKREGIIDPSRSCIRVIVGDNDWEGVPTVCAQCEDAQCAVICPVKAISRDETLGRMVIDYDRCIGCRMCVTACPFGLINFDNIGKRVIKCDLCDGDPECAKFCFHKAIQYVDISEFGLAKRRTTAEKLSGLIRNTEKRATVKGPVIYGGYTKLIVDSASVASPKPNKDAMG